MTSTWDESLETGNELIDRQHREVVDLLDELQEIDTAPEADVLRVLDKLMDFTVFHFTSEEMLMAQVSYPAISTEQMVEQHREFKDYARLRILEFRTGEMQSVLPLHAFLDEWLKVHEFGMDILLAQWIRTQNGEAAAFA